MPLAIIIGLLGIVFGICIIVFPRLLRYIVGAYFILNGILLLLSSYVV